MHECMCARKGMSLHSLLVGVVGMSTRTTNVSACLSSGKHVSSDSGVFVPNVLTICSVRTLAYDSDEEQNR